MKKTLFLTIIIFLLGILSCNTTEPPQHNNSSLKLSVADTSCSEVWLNLSILNINLPSEINLKRTGADSSSKDEKFFVSTADTMLYVDSLLPNHTYKFHTTIQSYSLSSNLLNVTTMDTTSHNFTFQTWTFGGQAGSCTLYDCAIISTDDIWCVGEIFIADTSMNGYTTYNAVHWDGSQWKLKRIKTNACGGVVYPPIKTIFTFSSDDILFAHIDGSISHYDGINFTNDCSLITQLNGSANKIWGVSRNDYYVVSGNGFIAHYQNGQWSRIESGTDLPIRDIWGGFNAETGKNEILAVAAEVAINNGSKVLRIDGNSVTEENNNGLSWDIGGIWFKPGRKYYIAGAGIHYKHTLSDSIWNRYSPGVATHYTGDGIKGNNINDVFTAGSFLEIAHYNGVTWHNYLDEISSFSGALGNISVKGNMAAVVGFEGSSALVVIGKRN